VDDISSAKIASFDGAGGHDEHLASSLALNHELVQGNRLDLSVHIEDLFFNRLFLAPELPDTAGLAGQQEQKKDE
jgi:hypothetical protein